MLKNTTNSYGTGTKIFHWIIGIIIIVMLAVGYIMTNKGNFAFKWQLYDLHKATGVTLLFLVSLRLIWRLMNIKVTLPGDLPSWQKIASHVNFIILYILMFAMPLSGLLMSLLGGRNINIYGLFTIEPFAKNILLAKIFKNIHENAAPLLCALIALHITAALYHHFIRKDNVLIRMIR